MKPKFAHHLLAAALLTAAAHGATISSFGFTSGSASSNDTEVLTTTSAITAAGAGLTGIDLVSDRLQVNGLQTTGNNRTGAVANNAYFSFTIDAPTTTLSLSQIAFDFGYFNSFGYQAQLRGSADNFASDLWIVGSTTQNNANVAVTAQSVNLSAISGYQNVSDDTFEFRFYVGDSSTSATRYAIFDNISVTGTATAIPEPSAALLGGLGMLVLLRRRR